MLYLNDLHVVTRTAALTKVSLDEFARWSGSCSISIAIVDASIVALVQPLPENNGSKRRVWKQQTGHDR